MSGWLVDTNVISEILRPQPDSRVMTWSLAASKEFLFLSGVSIGELHKGLTLMPAGARRKNLENSIEQLLPTWFSGRILPMTQSIAERWGILDAKRQLLGRPIQVPDAQITRNVKDFENLGVTILNPWESA